MTDTRSPNGNEEDWIEEVYALIEEDRPEEALDLLAEQAEDDPSRWLLEVRALYVLGAYAEANEALEQARTTAGADASDVLRSEAMLLIATWRHEEAAEVLARLDPDEEDPTYFVDLALLADLNEEHDRAHELLLTAHRLEPDVFPEPIRVEADAFQEVVSDAAAALPDPFQKAFETLPVIIDPMPTAEVLGAPASGLPPDLYGLFVGAPLHEETLPGELPPRIFLFQRNLERDARSLDELKEEIRITLYHELAHALGFEEDGVAEMGLG